MCLQSLSPLHYTSTLASNYMSDASTLAELPFGTGENMDPLPVPPCTTTPDASPSQLCIQNTTQATFICIGDSDFPHPDEPTPSELNDSDQENISPPISAVSHHGPSIRTPLSRTQVSIPFTEDPTTNQAIVSTITRVCNNVKCGDEYVGQIEEIIRITRTLRHRGTPSEDDEVAALVAQLDSIRRLESESSSSLSLPAANITFPTPTVPHH